MKLIARFENGCETELREIQGLNKDCELIIVKSMMNYHKRDLEEVERELSEKFNKKVIVLGGRFTDILVMPKNIDRSHGRSLAQEIKNYILRRCK